MNDTEIKAEITRVDAVNKERELLPKFITYDDMIEGYLQVIAAPC